VSGEVYIRYWEKISSLKGLSSTETGFPGRWLSHHPWRCLKNGWMCYFGVWLSRHGGVGLTGGLDDLRGLFQPMTLRFYDFMIL